MSDAALALLLLSSVVVILVLIVVWRGRGYMLVVSDEHLIEFLVGLGELKSQVEPGIPEETPCLLTSAGTALSWTMTQEADGMRHHLAISNTKGLDALASLGWVLAMTLDRLGVPAEQAQVFTVGQPVVHLVFTIAMDEQGQFSARPVDVPDADGLIALRDRSVAARDDLLGRLLHEDPASAVR